MNPDKSDAHQGSQSRAGSGVVRFLVKSLSGLVITMAVLFIPAGRLDWTMGWVYIAAFLLAQGVTALVIDAELLAERETRHGDEAKWDQVVVSIYGVFSALLTPLIAGLDFRYEWLPPMPLGIQIVGLVLFLLGWAISIWAMRANPYCSKIVRIQADRGHSVATAGPYRYVRHPGYVGTIVFSAAVPLLLGSVWALAPGALAVIVLVVRTALEDAMLCAELAGYHEYAQTVRYRLVPGIW